jgi:hypothetical protein
MPLATLTGAIDYKNKVLFEDRENGKIFRGETVTVTEGVAAHLAATGLFEIADEDAKPSKYQR